ncbi:MAG: aspartate/glutamate racemase family protein [Salaquimonas sp.]
MIGTVSMNVFFPTEKSKSPFMGILMLDTRFPRLPGDIGNPDSFDFPVHKMTVEGAFPKKIIKGSPENCLPEFIKAARNLEATGAKILTTSCGFLTLFQEELQAAVNIPVLTSSLFLYNNLQASLPPGKQVGILTIAASSLTERHLEAAGITNHPPIGTTEGGAEFTHAILNNCDKLDFDKACQDNVNAALALQNAHPNLGAILLECTNMPPYADAIKKATGLPVYSILDGLNDLWRTTNLRG